MSYLIGLVGAGIGPSLSPALHEREGSALGLRYVYRLLDLGMLARPAEAVGEIVAGARLLGYDGLNITHPCKQLVLGHVDELAPDAAAIGSVNTIVIDGDRTIGHNTDWSGFAKSVSRGLPRAKLDDVVLLGAGGAGAAAAHALLTLDAGVVHVLDVDTGRSAALAESLCERFGAGRARAGSLHELPTRLGYADGLVHATPTGMAHHPGMPVPPESLRPGLWVADIVYRPLRTELVLTARARGCQVLDGGGMAVFQAADALELFTGVTPNVDRMLRHFESLVGASPDRVA
ncbi:shikimate dehydrogenase [Flindersiella endophytica]